jgi:hypothetical protein
MWGLDGAARCTTAELMRVGLLKIYLYRYYVDSHAANPQCKLAENTSATNVSQLKGTTVISKTLAEQEGIQEPYLTHAKLSRREVWELIYTEVFAPDRT